MSVRRVLLVVLSVTVLTGVVVPLMPSTAAAASPVALGVFRGSGRADLVAEYEAWLGEPVGYTLDFVGRAPTSSTTPWANIDNPAWWCTRWASRSSSLVLSTAMLPNTNFTLAAGASGAYDAHWQQFGQTLVANGCADAILRLGWEFNGGFYPWAAGGKEASFAAYWRRIVTALRAVPNQQFRFDWTPLAGNTHANVEAAYPGDAYVDVIGLDAYDTSTVPATDAVGRWNDQLNRPWGLNWQRNFARAHGKAMSLPEWGLTVRPNDSLGGGDNPTYISNMWAWMRANPYLYTSYFEVDAVDASHRLMTGQFPEASALYRALVNQTTSATTSTTAPPATTTTTAPPSTTSTTTAPLVDPVTGAVIGTSTTSTTVAGSSGTTTATGTGLASTTTTVPPTTTTTDVQLAPAARESIWSSGATPAKMSTDTRAVEIGMKFRANTGGTILGIRFYKYASNGGTHVASLWKKDGTLLAQIPFMAETAAGWQQVMFPTPVRITAGTTYIASYHTNQGRYAEDLQTFTRSITNGHLTALKSGIDGGNGVFTYSANPTFPARSASKARNYWVDVVFLAG